MPNPMITELRDDEREIIDIFLVHGSNQIEGPWSFPLLGPIHFLFYLSPFKLGFLSLATQRVLTKKAFNNSYLSII